MNELLTIREVATRTGLSAHTLRYYERVGLLDAVDRASSGHRRYSEVDLAWIEFLNRLRATGMSIRRMREFAALRRHGDESIDARRALLACHQSEVEERVRVLLEDLAAVTEKIVHYRELEQRSRITERRSA